MHRAVDDARLEQCRKTLEAEKVRQARIAALAQQKESANKAELVLHPSMDVDTDSAAGHEAEMTSESMSMSSVPEEAGVSKESRSEPVIKQDDPSLHRPHRLARSIDVVPEVEAMDMSDEQQQVGQWIGSFGVLGRVIGWLTAVCIWP